MDFSTQEGWKKALVSMLGLVLMAASVFGLTAVKADTITAVATPIIEFLVVVGYWIVNQFAAKGKATQVIKVIEANSALITAVAKTGANVAPLVVALAATGTVTEPTPAVSLVKDRVAAAVAVVSAGKNYRQSLTTLLNETIESWKDHMLKVNPNYTTKDAIMEVVAVYLGQPCSEKQCSDIQAIMGLQSLLTSMSSMNILNTFFAAFDANPSLAWLEQLFKNAAIMKVKISIINEAAARAKAGDTNITVAKLALQEFGIPADAVEKTIWSGNTISKLFVPANLTTPGAIGGSFTDFNPYALAGYSELG